MLNLEDLFSSRGLFRPRESLRSSRGLVGYFASFNKCSAAMLMVKTPVRIDGSGTG